MAIHVDDGDDETVGYGRPPKHTRFKPGQSGNPGGRKPVVDFSEWENPLSKYLLEMRTVNIKGKNVRMPVVDIMIKTAIQRALSGCHKMFKVLLDGSGGLTALVQEQKRQRTKADDELIRQVREEVKNWNSDDKASPGSPDGAKK
ncbi:MAG TPA: DUF5681 domain-containing protein [Bradyrhizobium sp.]|jgi:hypothetical protein|nr:DUF5681 domain-containing protein [Bradyrhizobium sp.]